MQVHSVSSPTPLFSTAGDGWFSEDSSVDTKINLRVSPCDDHVSATIGGSRGSSLTLSDYLVAIVERARMFGFERLLIHNRTGTAFKKGDFPYAFSRASASIRFRRIAVVEPIDTLNDWTRLDIAFGRVFNVHVRRFAEAFDAVAWLAGK